MGGSCDVKLVKAAYGQDMNGRTQTAFSGGYLASNMCYITATCYISCVLQALSSGQWYLMLLGAIEVLPFNHVSMCGVVLTLQVPLSQSLGV